MLPPALAEVDGDATYLAVKVCLPTTAARTEALGKPFRGNPNRTVRFAADLSSMVADVAAGSMTTIAVLRPTRDKETANPSTLAATAEGTANSVEAMTEPNRVSQYVTETDGGWLVESLAGERGRGEARATKEE